MTNSTSDLVNKLLDVKSRCNFQSAIAQGFGLTQKEMECIMLIDSFKSPSSSEIAAAINLSPSRCSRIIGQLLKKELIQAATDLEDRRSLRFSLTKAGKVCSTKVTKERKVCEQRLFSTLSEEELAIVDQGLTLLLKRL